MLKNNYHTHTLYCNHAKGYAEDYVDYAEKLKFNEIGISDHAPIPLNHGMTDVEYNDNCCYQNMSYDTFLKYLKELDILKKRKNIKVYSGLESEYLINNEDFYKDLRSKVDYMILGMHFYNYDGKVLDTYRDVDYKTVDGYYEAIERAIKSGLFCYLAHPDLYMFDYLSINGIRGEFDAKAKEICLKLINLCVEYNIYFEINSNGIKYAKDKNKKELWRYPNLEFFKLVKEYMDNNPNKLKLIIGADAHEPSRLDCENIKLAEELIDELKLEVLDKIEVF